MSGCGLWLKKKNKFPIQVDVPVGAGAPVSSDERPQIVRASVEAGSSLGLRAGWARGSMQRQTSGFNGRASKLGQID